MTQPRGRITKPITDTCMSQEGGKMGKLQNPKVLAMHPHNGINTPPDPALTNRRSSLEAWFQQWAKAAPDTSSCRSCGHCPSCGRHSGCSPLKLRSSTSRLVKEPLGQSTRLVTQLPGSSSVCKAGSVANGCKEASWLPLRSKCLRGIQEKKLKTILIGQCSKIYNTGRAVSRVI